MSDSGSLYVLRILFDQHQINGINRVMVVVEKDDVKVMVVAEKDDVKVMMFKLHPCGFLMQRRRRKKKQRS